MCHIVSYHTVLWHIVLCHIVLWHRFVSYRFVSHRFVSYRFVTYRFMSYRFVSYRFVTYRFMSYRFVTYRFVSYRFVTYRFVTYHFVTYRFVTSFCVVSFCDIVLWHIFCVISFCDISFCVNRFVTYRFVSYLYVSYRFVLYRFVSYRFVTSFVSYLFVTYRFVSYRFPMTSPHRRKEKIIHSVSVCACVRVSVGRWGGVGWGRSESRYFNLITDQCRHHSTKKLLSLSTQNTKLNLNRDFKTNASKLSDILGLLSGAVEACFLLGCTVTLLNSTPLHTCLLQATEFFLRSWQFLSQSRNSPHSMQLEGSLPRLQQPTTCPYPEPDQTTLWLNPHHTSWRPLCRSTRRVPTTPEGRRTEMILSASMKIFV